TGAVFRFANFILQGVSMKTLALALLVAGSSAQAAEIALRLPPSAALLEGSCGRRGIDVSSYATGFSPDGNYVTGIVMALTNCGPGGEGPKYQSCSLAKWDLLGTLVSFSVQ